LEYKLKVPKNSQFTRCPNCKTAFRVSEQLLAKAAGKVRCGACLEIFQATDFLLKPSTPTETKANSTTMVRNMVEDSLNPNDLVEPTNQSKDQNNESNQPSSSKPQRKPTIEFDAAIRNNPFERLVPTESDLADDQLDIDDSDNERQHRDDVDFNEWVDEEFEETTALTEDDDLETAEQSTDPEKEQQQGESIRALTQEIDALLDFDEIAEDKIETPTETATQEKNPPSDIDYDAVFEHDIFADERFEAPLDSDGKPELGQTQSMFFDESMLDNLGQQPAKKEPKKGPQDQSENDASVDDEEIISIEEYEQQMGIKYNLDSQLGSDGYEPDPLDEFDSVVEDYPSELRSKMIMLASAILVFILLMQIWSNRQAIAWSDTWGGAMTGVCVLLPCDLKPQRDISKIKLLQRQVSPDEELEETLDIKVMFVNQAHFEQPYPNIKIIFSDSNNNPVSTKIFKPAEYLKNSRQNELMPVNTEVHIEFKTDLEYPDALGFEFIFE